MSRKLSESAVIRAFAAEICQRLTRKMIATLQKMNDGLLSGDSSGLENTWDEICAQVQYELSVYWDAYDQTVRSLAEAEVEKLLPHEREAIWLQTPEAFDWEFEDESRRNSYPVRNDDIVGYLAQEYLYREASKWSNQRIREYLDRAASNE